MHLSPLRRATPCVDDYVPHGYIAIVKCFEKLQEAWVVTNRGVFGPPGYHDWTADAITWEADPQHVDLIRMRTVPLYRQTRNT